MNEPEAAESPQAAQERANRARRRFRAIVRLVIANRAWLLEEAPEGERAITENVQKNVKLFTTKRQPKSILTLQQKAILCKAPKERTEEDKDILYKTISNIKVFRKYDDVVKRRLAGCAYFRYFGPGRILVRQNHEAHALYFVISGDMSVSVTTFDPVLNYYENTFLKTLTRGDMFGEVSLLSGMKRSATITSNTPVELLLVDNSDFNEVLRQTLQTQWNYIIGYLDSFTYFREWDYPLKRSCCVVSKLKNFAKGEIILGDGYGMPQYVHVLLKGKCRLIEHLLLDTTYSPSGKLNYKLHVKPKYDDDEEDLATFIRNQKTNKPVPTTRRDVPYFGGSPRKSTKKMDSKRGNIQFEVSNLARNKSGRKHRLQYSQNRLSIMEFRTHSSNRRLTTQSLDDEISQIAIQDTSAVQGPELEYLHYFPKNVKTVFMQVCIFSEKACFCVGENMERRRIVALTPVEMLLIPRYWMDTTPNSNTWGQIRAYLDARIPSTKKIFASFLQKRQWRSSIHIPKCKRPTLNTISNVPYSIRVRDGFDL